MGINLGRNVEENHGILKGAMVDQWVVTLHEVELYVVKRYCERLMYIFIKEMDLKEFRYITYIHLSIYVVEIWKIKGELLNLKMNVTIKVFDF